MITLQMTFQGGGKIMNRFFYFFTGDLWLVDLDHPLIEEVFVIPNGVTRFLPVTYVPAFTSDDVVRKDIKDTSPSDLIFNTAECVRAFFNNIKGE